MGISDHDAHACLYAAVHTTQVLNVTTYEAPGFERALTDEDLQPLYRYSQNAFMHSDLGP